MDEDFNDRRLSEGFIFRLISVTLLPLIHKVLI